MSEPSRILGKLATLPMAALGVLLAATLVVEADAGWHLDRRSYLAAAVLVLAAAGGWLLTRPPTSPEPLRRLRRRTGRLVFGTARTAPPAEPTPADTPAPEPPSK
jgi:hypothetical protein